MKTASPARPSGRGVRGRDRRAAPRPTAAPQGARRRPGEPLRVGDRVSVRFASVNASGDAVARVEAATVAVPFAIPGESAVIVVTRAGRRAEGRLVQVLRKSPDATAAPCPHFGRCGGCQWQHMDVALQRRLKTTLTRDVLEARAGVGRHIVADAVGGSPWAYRGTVRATVAVRDGDVVAGFHVRGAQTVMNVSRCPVQHPANDAMFGAVRHAMMALRLPIYEPATGRGLVRGFLGTASFATGEALLTLSLAGPPPDAAAIVHAVIDRVPGLVGVLVTEQGAPHGPLLGRSLRLLWGRATVEEVIAGLRVPIGPHSDVPANPHTMGLLCDAVVRATAMGPDAQACDLTAASPVFALAMAAHAGHVVGVVPRRADVRPAEAIAAHNGVANVTFTTRDPLRDVHRRRDDEAPTRARHPDAVVASSQGPGLDDAVIATVAAAGVRRVASVARTLGGAVNDLTRWQRAGYRVLHVQPLDVLPQTSHVHVVVTMERLTG
jgi:23S rRNA (uracil1939-C5)-methyltransferase